MKVLDDPNVNNRGTPGGWCTRAVELPPHSAVRA